jgi:mRNA-degrading endonuclease RelE of RelBE toxin-antitoxin system
VPKFRVIAHRRVHKYLRTLRNERLKHTIIEAMEKLEDYPVSLREMDVATIKGLKKTFRIRVGQHRIIFYVDKPENTIYVTHLDTRKKVYNN